jgi:hypothetical protein
VIAQLRSQTLWLKKQVEANKLVVEELKKEVDEDLKVK